ncbi:PREDICTED: germin-like protein subfamily 3 member 2 [Tarenaya hassleriana]|uniref:germin-like protein subfamily 3 member 2 n=1 Tax=Tarenaya hassleriana TaxID=28532 RepID=UPI00053C13F7|nr:PREDICTED: germin-like protein subfamily 3 member 2 [Tarenaya hassleriana]
MALPRFHVIVLPFLFMIIFSALASDPDPVQDFCIRTDPSTSAAKLMHPSCKNVSNVSVEDFIYGGIKSRGNFDRETGLAAKSVNVDTFPALNTLGMSFVRADLEVGGINVPHYHPRATEVAYVMEGKVYSGFVDTESRVFARVIEQGEVMVFPKGLLHFQMNIGDEPAAILGMFNGQNPGLMKLPRAIFGSGIKEELLEKSFGLNRKEIDKLKRMFGPNN